MRSELVGQVWLVKSSDRILGPFTTEEVAQKLRTKEIVVIDECVTPMSRWRLLRDEPYFHSVIEEIRKGLLTQREDTEIQGNTNNHTQTLTDPSISVTLDMQTAAAAAIDRSGVDQSQIKDAEFTEEDIPPVVVQSTGPLRSTKVRNYGVSSDYKIDSKKSASGAAVAAWITAGLVLAGAAYMWTRSQTPSPERAVSSQNYDRLLNEGSAAWDEGDFPAALELYRQANRQYPGRPEVVARLAPLLIRLEGQTVAAKRALNEAIESSKSLVDRRIKSELELGLGLAAMAGDDYGDADSHFRSAMTISPASFPAHFNTGAVAFQNKLYDDAAKRFAGAGDEPAALFMAAKSLAMNTKGDRAAHLREAESSVLKLLQKHQNFRQEALVLGAAIDADRDNTKGALTRVLAALDTDPDATSDHWQDPFLYLVPLEWRSLLPHCRKINDQLNAPASRALLALCHFKAGDVDSAHRVIADAQAAAPEESFLQSVNAYILASVGRTEDAQAALALATKQNTTKLALSVRARLCTRLGDTACAERAWQELVNSDAQPLAALTGLASLRSQQGDRKSALELVKRAMALSPKYRPALAFKEE